MFLFGVVSRVFTTKASKREADHGLEKSLSSQERAAAEELLRASLLGTEQVTLSDSRSHLSHLSVPLLCLCPPLLGLAEANAN